MAVPDAIEARMADALVAAVQVVTGAPNWRTAPAVYVGDFPTTPVDVSTAPQVFLNHVATTRLDGLNSSTRSGFGRYGWQSTFVFFIAAPLARTVWNVKADIEVAVQAARGTASAAFGQPFWLSDFNTRDDLRTAGVSVATLTVTIEYDTDAATA